MAETKDEISAERDQLRVENEQLKAQLAATAAGTAGRAAVPYTFQLSEGDRQELEARGVLNVGGRLLTREQVLGILPDDQKGVEIAEAPEGTRVTAEVSQAARDRELHGGVRGVDYVWPSVAPGQIDPSVAGTPGISGPSATAVAAGDALAAPTVDDPDGTHPAEVG